MQYLEPKGYKGKRTQFPYPNDAINPTLKREKEYYLAFNQAMLADYASNYCAIPYEFGQKRGFEELRSYARGQQTSDKLKRSLFGEKRKQANGKYPTKMNVSFDKYYKLPQLFDSVRTKNMEQEYDVEIHCIDDDSIAAKNADRELLKFLLDRNTQDFINKTQYKPNVQLDPQSMGLKSEADVDRYFQSGGYTLQWEMACKAACLKTKMSSDFKVLQDATFDDLITNPFGGITGWKTYIEASTKLPKIRKVIPERCIIPYSDKNDYSDITRAGEIRVMSLADIRKENPHLTANDLLYLAECFQWMNPEIRGRLAGLKNQNQGLMPTTNKYDIDPVSRCKVLVLDSQWLSVDIETNLKNDFSNGGGIYKPVAFDYQLDKKAARKGDKVVKKNVIKKYYSQWIIGTDYFLNYGICKDVVYYGEDGNKTPRIDYFFTRTGNASLIERSVAIVDDIDLMIIKQRNTLATLPAAPAIVIQKDLLENVFLNGILQQPEDIIQTLIERGVLYYNGLDDHGKPLYFAGGQKPIDFLDLSKIFSSVSAFSAMILEKVNELREVWGLQNGADSGAASPYQGLGQTKLAFQAANASLYPTFNAFNYLFKAAFDDIIKKWQIVAKDKEIPLTYSVLGNKNLEILRLGKNFTNAEFNCEVTIAPSLEEKQALLAEITQLKSLGAQTNGSQGLTTSEYIYVWRKIMAGNIEEAMYVLSEIEDKKRQEAQAINDKNVQDNAKVQQDSAQMKGQMDQQAIELKGQQQKTDTLLAGLLKQNQALLELMYAPKAEGVSSTNPQEIHALVGENNQAIANIVVGGEQEEMPTEEQPQQVMQSM